MKQINKVNLGKRISKKERNRLQQDNADNELVLKWFFGGLIIFGIIGIIIFKFIL